MVASGNYYNNIITNENNIAHLISSLSWIVEWQDVVDGTELTKGKLSKIADAEQRN